MERYLEVLGRCLTEIFDTPQGTPADYLRLAQAWIKILQADWTCLAGSCRSHGWHQFLSLCKSGSKCIADRLKLAFLLDPCRHNPENPYSEQLYYTLVECMGHWRFPHFPDDKHKYRLDLLADWRNMLGQARRNDWVKAHRVPRLVEVIDYHFELTKPDREGKFPFECCILPWGQPYFHMAMDHMGGTGRELYETARDWPGKDFFKERYPAFFGNGRPPRAWDFKTEADGVLGFYFWCSTEGKTPTENEWKEFQRYPGIERLNF